MPRTLKQVQQLLDQLKHARDDMDAQADTEAPRKVATADALEVEADTLEAEIATIRQRQNARDAKDQAGRDADTIEMRMALNTASQKRQKAAKERMNAARMLSLKHDVERASDKEICVHCVARYDDNGDIIGATHITMSIDDIPELDEAGVVLRTRKGLRSLLRADEADLAPDGRLRIGNSRVGR